MVVAAALLALPTPHSVASHASPEILSPVNGDAIASSTISITGTAAGDAASVAIYEGTQLRATASVSAGHWSASVGFTDGTHTVVARARDAANSESASSAPVTFSVDTVQPAVPIITAPEEGSTLIDANITVEGTAEPNARVEVSVSTGGTLTATAGSDGTWRATRSFTSATHTLRARAIDAAGNRSSLGPARSFTVDLVNPNAPIVIGPSQGEIINSSLVRLFGSAEPNSTVTILEGSPLATTTTASDGTWSVSVTFPEATHGVQTRATDQAGRHSALSDVRTFTVDLTPPTAPTIMSPLQESVVEPTVTVSGTAEPGARIDLLQGSSAGSYGSTTAGSDGRWTMSVQMPHGYQSVSARAIDEAGNMGSAANPRTFIVDADKPSVSFTTADGTIYWPSDSTKLRGRASDSYGVAVVELQFYDVLGRALPYRLASCAQCPSGTEAEWFSTYTPPRGRYVVKAYAIDRAGHRSEGSVITIVRL